MKRKQIINKPGTFTQIKHETVPISWASAELLWMSVPNISEPHDGESEKTACASLVLNVVSGKSWLPYHGKSVILTKCQSNSIRFCLGFTVSGGDKQEEFR